MSRRVQFTVCVFFPYLVVVDYLSTPLAPRRDDDYEEYRRGSRKTAETTNSTARSYTARNCHAVRATVLSPTIRV